MFTLTRRVGCYRPAQARDCRGYLNRGIIQPAQRRWACPAAAKREDEDSSKSTQCSKPGSWLPEPLKQIPGASLLAAVGTLAASLPAWAAETFDPFITDSALDPAVADTPHIFEALLFTLVAYFTIILLWVWVSSFAEEPGPHENLGDQELPPSFSRYLHANIRSYNDPSERAAAIKEQVCNAHNLDELKHGMSLQASESLQQQIRDCVFQVRSKVMLAKRLSGNTGAMDESLSKLLASSSSKPIDRFIDDCIAGMDIAKYNEPALVRRVLRRTAAKLAMDEVTKCLDTVRSQSEVINQQQHRDPLLVSSKMW